MQQTPLAKMLLNKAAAIQNEYGSAQLCACHIAAAAADFCRTAYTGLDVSDCSYPRFEEERLRYLFAKEVKPAGYFRLRLSQNSKKGVAEQVFDITRCEQLTASRNASLLSADILFLSALIQLHPSYLPAVKTARSAEAAIALLQDADSNICDYVIESIEAIRDKLQKKAAEAAAIRDWKPAAKFAEPEILRGMFFQKIEARVFDNVLILKLPKFFGTTDLKLSIHSLDGVYYVHDNGCAFRHLAKQVKEKEKLARILKRVCHSCRIREGKITGCFVQTHTFLYYLQRLIFVAHADLYYTRAAGQLCRKDKGTSYVGPENAEPLDADALLNLLRQSIAFGYDENSGLYYWLDTRYSLFSTRCAFLLETLENRKIRISDRRKGEAEGSIFEAFYWNHENLAQHKKFICKIAARFGGEFDGNAIFLTEKAENFFQAATRFFNMAVLLSEFGHDISL